MTPEQIAEGRRVLADALGTDAMPVTARERDLAQSEYRVWAANNLQELLNVAEGAARLRDALLLAQHAMRAPLDDWKGVLERKALDAAREALMIVDEHFARERGG